MIELVLEGLIVIAFALAAFRFHVLDLGGALFSSLIGGAIIYSQGVWWFSLLLIFFLLGAITTRYKHNLKRMRLHERTARKAMNVIANGSIPALIALLSIEYDFSVPFVAAISVALADTFASELGVLSDKAYLITTLKRVSPGTNGAVSLLGEATAVVGAMIIAFAGFFAVNLTIYETGLCIILGLFGCHIDSLLGATFQGKYKGTMTGHDTIITNSDVNLISVALTTLLAVVLVEII